MIFPMTQRAKNDRSVRRALPVYDNAIPGACSETTCMTLFSRGQSESHAGDTPSVDLISQVLSCVANRFVYDSLIRIAVWCKFIFQLAVTSFQLYSLLTTFK